MDPAPIAPTDATPPPAEPAWHEKIMTGDKLNNPADWLDSTPAPLSQFIKDNMTAARAKTEGLLKPPGENDPPEAWDSFYKALGRPDTPEGYGIAKPEQLPDGVEWDDGFAKGFAEFAHSAGIPKGQAEKLIAWHTGQIGEQAKAMKAAGEALLAAERKELADTFGGKLNEAATTAQKLAAEIGVPASLFDPGAADFAGAKALKVVAALSEKLAKFTGEGSFGNSGNAGQTPGGGPAYAEAVISRKHPDSELYYKGDAEIKRRVADGLKRTAA